MTVEAGISWMTRIDDALRQARGTGKLVLLDFSAAAMWTGCARLDAEVYSNPRVADLISTHFIPIRVHVQQQKAEFKKLGDRYGAHWTPTILVLDADGEERHRIEGFLPVEDFAAQLLVALGRAAFQRGAFAEAEPRFRQVLESYPNTDAAPEALYWAGVSKYKSSGDATALGDTAREFSTRYTDSTWAKKASVWKA